MKIFQSLRNKILLVFAVCASIILLGFFAVYWLTLKQHHSLQQHSDLPSVSISWFRLNKGILRSTWAHHTFINSGSSKFLKERELAWEEDINPSFKLLGLLYKKSRVWTEERSVERRAFYDLRLMILDLKNIQKKSSELAQTDSPNNLLLNWSKKEWPLVQKIIQQIEILVRWQTDFAQQQTSELQELSSGLGIWIWIIASIVFIFVLVIALFFAKRISAPLKKLRSEIHQVINEQTDEIVNKSLINESTSQKLDKNEDEVKKLTEAFREMEYVIRERTELLQNSNRQLEKANRAKGIFLTNMSHELRTPLNAIIGFAEVLLESKDKEPLSNYQADRLSRIYRSGKHLLELINSLLDLSKIEAGQMEIQKKDFQLKTLLQDIIEWLEPLLQEKSLEYELIFQENKLFLLHSDLGKVRQVFINLIGNSIKFTGKKGRIEIRSSQNEKGIFVDIKDNGCGISEDQQEQIFKVFHQAKHSSNFEEKKGTGLGLALVQSLMKLLGGSVSMKSEIGKGSIFTLHFPTH